MMKRTLLIPIIIMSCTFCKAQRVTYNELKYVLTHNLGQVEEYLSAKGFNYMGADTAIGEGKKVYSSKFTISYKNYVNNFSIAKDSMDGGDLDASFSTHLKSDYLAFKASIKKLGYILGNSRTLKNGSLFIEYNKGSMSVAFSISRMKEFNTEYYIISLMNRNSE